MVIIIKASIASEDCSDHSLVHVYGSTRKTMIMYLHTLTLLHSEWTKLHRVLAVLSIIRLKLLEVKFLFPKACVYYT